jgi:hypothetical protein
MTFNKNPYYEFIDNQSGKKVSVNLARIETFEPYHIISENLSLTRVCLFNGGVVLLKIEYTEFESIIEKWFSC